MTDTVFYDTKAVAKCLGCSIPTARNIMYRADFPLVKAGKNLSDAKKAGKYTYIITSYV